MDVSAIELNNSQIHESSNQFIVTHVAGTFFKFINQQVN